MLDIAVPAYLQEGGTYVIPGHGRVGDEADILTFRDMLVIVRARIADLIAQGKTLAQVQEARPALDYDSRYGNDNGDWTSAQFVEAVYTRSQGEGQRMMRAAIVVGAAFLAALGARHMAALAQRSGAAAADAAQLGARRSDGLLGRRRQRGLAASNGDARARATTRACRSTPKGGASPTAGTSRPTTPPACNAKRSASAD